ncbi:acetyl-CoA synthetase-like protein [Xylariomycetidae sp. FL2044]|nr:acetyl-CoA synthetase-like protein [Xylariomycetidae sp. FL2044]
MTQLTEPEYGRRLMPCVLDEIARATPQKLFAAIPKSNDPADGFVDVSFADVARCVDFIAWKIESRFGRGQNFETISYVGIPDLCGPLVFYAAVKCGYKVLIPSPRNPPSVNLSLMEQTGCIKLLYAAEVIPIVKPLDESNGSLEMQVLPSLEDMLHSAPQPYPYVKSFEEARDEPILVLHSSGSTGLPKPITMTNGSFAVIDNERNLPAPPGRRKSDFSMWDFKGEGRVYSVFPFFHLGGFVAFAVNPVFYNAHPVLGPPHMLPNGDLLKQVLLHQKIQALVLVPAVAEQLLKEPNGLEFFRNIEFLCYSGAPFSPSGGNLLSKVVHLASPFGTTEIFPQPELVVDPEDWEWHEFSPNMRHEMDEYDPQEGTYELVMFADESNKDTAAVFHNLPGEKVYRTKDLFVRHPTKPQLFKFVGRKDDIIVLANGEKFNPLPLEAAVQSHPLVKGALAVGSSKTQTALLVEPKEPVKPGDRGGFIRDMWPHIEKSNGFAAGQGRIHPGKVLCVSPEKPLARTGKGTIVRRLSEEAYKQEIEALYADTASVVSPSAAPLKPSLRPTYGLPAVIQFVRDVFTPSFPRAADIEEEEDFFQHGLDSVQTLEVVSALKHSIRDQGWDSKLAEWITPRTIFQNSNLHGLASLLKTSLETGTLPKQASSVDVTRILNETVAKYVAGFQDCTASRPDKPSNTSKIALVGSTGYLGTYLLASLLRKPEVSRVYCLNRSIDAKARQEASLRKLDETLSPFLLDKVSYLTVSLGRPSLGLAEDAWATLSAEVGVVIYNSWRLDFSLAIHSFAPFLQATQDLVRLSLGARHAVKIIFVSSLAAVGNLAKRVSAPEGPVQDPSAALNTGYAHSKLAAEMILETAGRVLHVPVSVVRIGQIGGASSEDDVLSTAANAAGASASSANRLPFADQPWISGLIRTAREIDCMPMHVGLIDWVPVDTIAAVLRDIALHSDPAVAVTGEGAQFLHIYPAETATWEMLSTTVCEKYGISKTAPLREWVKMLREMPRSGPEDVRRLPALRMLDHYEALGEGMEGVACDINAVARISKLTIPKVNRGLLEAWLQSWDL